MDAQCSGGDIVRCTASLNRMLSLAELEMGRQRRESECQFLPPSVKPSRPPRTDSYLEEGEQQRKDRGGGGVKGGGVWVESMATCEPLWFGGTQR